MEIEKQFSIDYHHKRVILFYKKYQFLFIRYNHRRRIR